MNPKSTVLIVDDEPLNRTLFSAQLSSDLYNFIFAQDGAAALDKVKADFPDIILLDVMMPGMNGFEVLKKLKEAPDFKDIPVILRLRVKMLLKKKFYLDALAGNCNPNA